MTTDYSRIEGELISDASLVGSPSLSGKRRTPCAPRVGLALLFVALATVVVVIITVGGTSSELNQDFSEPNPPIFNDNVFIFSPDDPTSAQQSIDSVFATNGGDEPAANGHWVDTHYALMFLPGSHEVDVKVGYYTSVIGLGNHPRDVNISNVEATNGNPDYQVGALDNFWRSAENFYTTATKRGGNMIWSVSQAVWMRSVHVPGLQLFYTSPGEPQPGYASGGYLSNCRVDGALDLGPQQQFFIRNSVAGSIQNGAWNRVGVGNTGGIPEDFCTEDGTPQPATVYIDETPSIAEKPYITADATGQHWSLVIPGLEANKAGPSVSADLATSEIVPFEGVYVAKPGDSAATINAKLKSVHVVLCPGLYHIQEPIVIDRPGAVLLGIGFATLVSANGTPCLIVKNVDGVRVGGILYQAGPMPTEVLVQWGEKLEDGSVYEGSAENPSILYDGDFRVGGPNDPFDYEVYADVMLEVNSGNVILDQIWAWRADHGKGPHLVRDSMNPCYNGVVVNGDDVLAYGLFAEHTLHDQVVWNGERGRTYFFQCELPYDVTQENFGDQGYVGYRVSPDVMDHQAWGLGVYSFFRDHVVDVANGYAVPERDGVILRNMLVVHLDGVGSITNVINGRGVGTNTTKQTGYVCDQPHIQY